MFFKAYNLLQTLEKLFSDQRYEAHGLHIQPSSRTFVICPDDQHDQHDQDDQDGQDGQDDYFQPRGAPMDDHFFT